MVRKKWQVQKDCIDVRLSRIWYEIEDEAESIQITIEKTKRSDDVYSIIVDYTKKK